VQNVYLAFWNVSCRSSPSFLAEDKDACDKDSKSVNLRILTYLVLATAIDRIYRSYWIYRSSVILLKQKQAECVLKKALKSHNWSQR